MKNISMQVVRRQIPGMKPCTAPSPIVCRELLHQNELQLSVPKSDSHGFNFGEKNSFALYVSV
jgi:hypothetical protein